MLLAQAGVIRAGSIHQLFDLAQVFSSQPLPAGHRVGVIGNSAALNTLVVQRARAEGLRIERPTVSMHPEVGAEDFGEALRTMYADPGVDSVVVTFAPSAGAGEREIAAILADEAALGGKTTVACFLGVHGVSDELTAFSRASDGSRRVHSVPSFIGPEDAVWSLARATDYGAWVNSDHGRYPELENIDYRAARTVIERALERGQQEDPHARDEGRPVVLERSDAATLLAAYGIEVVPFYATHTVDEALQKAQEIGYPVALKAVHKRLRHRLELGGVRLDITNPDELRSAWNGISAVIERTLSAEDDHAIDVQRMAPTGTACTIRAGEDPLLGPMVSFALAGDASELLEDVQHRVAPLTDVDAAAMVRGLKASPKLFGYRGLPVMNVEPVEDVLLRLSELVDDFPAVRSVAIRPINVTEGDAYILSAKIELTAQPNRIDSARRRMA